MSKNSFMKGAAILGAAGIFIKILGAIFRIPLNRIIGAEGMGYYQVGYSMYNFLLAFTAIGFPTAISKLVSEKRTKGDYIGANNIFKVGLRLLFVLGFLGMVILWFIADYYVRAIDNPNGYYAVIAMAPAIFLVAVQASFRGYFQGMNDMVPTATSQIFEQLGRVVMGLLLSFLALNYLSMGLPVAAASASFGASIGAFCGLAVIVIIYLSKKRNNKLYLDNSSKYEKDSNKTTIKNILSISIPISISAAVVPIINLLDTGIVVKKLEGIGYLHEEAVGMFGLLQGNAMTLINLPQVLTAAIAVSLVPIVSEAFSKRDISNLNSNITSGIKVSSLIGFPAALGLMALAEPVMVLLFSPDNPEVAGRVLFFLAPSIILISQIHVLAATLQGMGKAHLPVIYLFIGAFFKLIITWTLVPIESINIIGATIGTFVAYFIAFVLNLITVKRVCNIKIDFLNAYIKPIISVIIMAIIVRFSYDILRLSIGLGNTMSTFVSISIGAVVFFLLVIFTRTLSEEDFNLIPKGDKLKNLLTKLNIKH